MGGQYDETLLLERKTTGWDTIPTYLLEIEGILKRTSILASL